MSPSGLMDGTPFSSRCESVDKLSLKSLSANSRATSFEDPKRSKAVPNGVRSTSPIANGVYGNGGLLNGLSGSPEGNGGLEKRSYSTPNGGQDLLKQSSIERKTKLAARDDGFFAENPVTTTSCGFFTSSTSVKLSASTSELLELQIDGTTQVEGLENGWAREEKGDGPVENGTLTNVTTQSDATAPNTASRTVTQVHRISSPPAFTPGGVTTSSTPSLVTPQPGKLQQRHTLEVPRLSTTSRMSRDSTRLHDDAAGSGAFSNATNMRRTSLSLIRKATRTGQSDLQLDEAPPHEDADRWAEMIRQKRASKRRRREDDDDERVVMGTKVDQGHENYITAYNMLTGIRFTVSRINAKLDRELTDADFTAKHKFSFDITGNELTPSAKYDFKFKDYAPWVFRHLRSIFRLDPADYLMSLTSKYILSELGSPGKSGSFFYFSRDYKYIIKTIHHAEHKVLRKILREYYDHVKDNPNTLLSQFYGLHRVKIPYGRKIHFVVMNNLFPPHRDIHKTFDLKGSTIGRDFKEEDLDKNPRATLKDLNWTRRKMNLELGPSKKHVFIEQMQKDVALLQKLKIMDYSLLIGIHDLSRGNEDKLREKNLKVFDPAGDKSEEGAMGAAITPIPTIATLMRTPSKLESQRKARELRESLMNEKPVPTQMPEEISDTQRRKDLFFYNDDGGIRATHEDDEPGEQIYYLGIIDCLTHYGMIKRIEHFLKSIGRNDAEISAVPPDRYGDRFIHFIAGNTMSKELAAIRAEEQPTLIRPSQSAPAAVVNEPPSSPTGLSQQKADNAVGNAEREAAREAARSPPNVRHPGEHGVPDRSLGTVQSPTPQGRGGEKGEGSATLPVVEEVGESNSANGSARSSVGPASRSNSPGEAKGLPNSKRPVEAGAVGKENGRVVS